MRRFSIKTRLIQPLVAAIVGLYALTAFGVYSFVASMIWKQFDEALRNELLDFIPETRVKSDGSIHAEFHEMHLPRFSDDSHEAFYQVWNRHQETLIKSPSLPADFDLRIAGLAFDQIAIVPAELPGGSRGRVATVLMTPAGVDENSIAEPVRVFLAVAHADGEIRGTLSKLAKAQIVAGVLLALCGIVAIPRVVERSFRPFGDFASIASKLGSDNLSERLPDGATPEEIRPFLAQLNSMLDRVEAGFDRERRFSASVAHELRTPIAELRSLMEVASADGGDECLRENPAAVYREGAEIAKRMGALVDNLGSLLHFRGALSEEKLKLEPVFAGRILEAAVAICREDAAERRIKFRVAEWEGDERLVLSDEVLLRALVDNLLSNAVCHAPAGTDVLIRREVVEGDLVRLEVVNDRGDLDTGDLELMAEPFWRKDDARTSGDRFGLGLALASSYAEALSSELHLDLRGEQFVASFCVPLATVEEAIPAMNCEREEEVVVH